jgi:regulator of replication initiation timing
LTKNTNVWSDTWNLEKITQLEEQLSWMIEQLSGLQAENEKLKEYLSGAIDIIKTFKTENELLQTNVDKYKSLIVDDKLRNNTWVATINTNSISSNKINFRNQSHDTTNSICKRYNSEWLPNTNWWADAKFINSKFQDVWDNWQHLVSKHISEANQILNSPWLTNKDRCRYSWLIDALQTQRWYIKSYKTENWATTIGIDFISYQDDISKIKYDWPPWLELMKNTSTKVRYYKLSSNPQLQTLNLDSHGNNIAWHKYLNNFNNWLNEHCNNNPIYNWESWWAWYTGEINWKQANWIDHFCVKNRLLEFMWFMWETWVWLQFNSNWDLQKIDLNWRHMFLAG